MIKKVLAFNFSFSDKTPKEVSQYTEALSNLSIENKNINTFLFTSNFFTALISFLNYKTLNSGLIDLFTNNNLIEKKYLANQIQLLGFSSILIKDLDNSEEIIGKKINFYVKSGFSVFFYLNGFNNKNYIQVQNQLLEKINLISEKNISNIYLCYFSDKSQSGKNPFLVYKNIVNLRNVLSKKWGAQNAERIIILYAGEIPINELIDFYHKSAINGFLFEKNLSKIELKLLYSKFKQI